MPKSYTISWKFSWYQLSYLEVLVAYLEVLVAYLEVLYDVQAYIMRYVGPALDVQDPLGHGRATSKSDCRLWFWFCPVHAPAAPEPPASLSAGLFGRTTACLTDHQPETRSGVHSESPGLLARASGPVSVLGYFNLHVWHQLFYQYTEYRNKKLRRINSEHSIVHH